MRALGTLLMLLGAAGLIVGVVTGITTLYSVIPLVMEFQETSEFIGQKIEDVNSVFKDVDKVHADANTLFEAYESGTIRNIGEEKIQQTLSQVRSVISRSVSLKNSIESELGDVEDLKDRFTSGFEASWSMAIISLASLILSGWFFGFGAVLKYSRRDIAGPIGTEETMEL